MSMSMAEPVSPIVTSLTKTFSTTPPRIALVLILIPRSRSGLLMAHCSTKTSRAPPLISLPIVTPPCPARIRQPRTTTRSTGTLTRLPSALRPDLRAMQSSPVSKVVSSIRTSEHDSGLQPSLLGPREAMVTRRTVTFEERTG